MPSKKSNTIKLDASSKRPTTFTSMAPTSIKVVKQQAFRRPRTDAPVTKQSLVVPRGKLNEESSADKFHDAYNQYWNTLKCAEQVHGVKIPDVDFQASGTLTVVEKATVTSSSNGVAAACWGGMVGPGVKIYSIPTYEACGLGNSSTSTYVSGAFSGSAATTSAPFSVVLGAAGVGVWQQRAFVTPGSTSATASGQVPILAHDLRLVSASMVVEQTAAATSNGGYYVGNSLPSDYFDSQNPLSALSVSQLSNTPGAARMSVSDGPLVLRYAPTDNSSLEYKDLDQNNGDTGEFKRGNPAMMFFVADGVSASQTFIITLTQNWEYLPRSANSLFGISPSMIDREALDYALTRVQDLELVTTDRNVMAPNTSGLQSSFSDCNATVHPAGSVTILRGLGKSKSRMIARAAKEDPLVEEEGSLFDQVVNDVGTLAKRYLPKIFSWL